MSEQVVQTYITWTHGAQPTRLQFHGPGALLDRPIRLTTSPPPPPSLPLLLPPPPPPPPPPPVILHPQFMPSVRSPSISAPRGQSCPTSSKSQRARRSIYSAGPSRRTTQSRALVQTISDSISFSAAAISTALYSVLFQTCWPSIAIPIGNMQALLSRHPAPWTEMSFPLCS